MKKRFGIDIDGTVTTPDAFIPFVNQDFQVQLTLEDFTEYYWAPLMNVDRKELYKWYFERETEIYQSSPVAEGATEVLKEWSLQNELVYISARTAKMLDVTKEWFHRHDIPFNRIELLGSHDKVQAAKDLKVDIFLEDKHDNAVNIHEECEIGRAHV